MHCRPSSLTTSLSKTTSFVIFVSFVVIKQPRRLLTPAGLVGLDLVHMLQGQADIVEAVQQAVLAKRIDVKIDGPPWSGVTICCASRSTVRA